MSDKYIVRVIRKRTTQSEVDPGKEKEQVDQIFEQEFDKFDIGGFAVGLNKAPEAKNGQEKDKESIKP